MRTYTNTHQHTTYIIIPPRAPMYTNTHQHISTNIDIYTHTPSCMDIH